MQGNFNFNKYKETIMYTAIVVVIAVFLFQQVQPKFVSTLKLYGEVKTQKEVADGISKQLDVARAKVARKNKMRMLDDMTKKIYQPGEAGTDSESTFAVLLEDIFEMARKNHIKTHSIKSTIDPEDDVFVKGDKTRFSACKIDLKMVADYTNFESFLTDLYRYNYLININNIEVYPYQKDKRILLINLTITLYASKSEEEQSKVESENKEGEEEEEE